VVGVLAVAVLKFAPVLRARCGYAASWLLERTAQAALSAGVPHGWFLWRL